MLLLKDPPSITFTPRGEAPKSIGAAFFRGEFCNFNPYREDREAARYCERFLLKGFIPPAPLITRGVRVTTFGSCFAEEINNYLRASGYSIQDERAPSLNISRYGEGLASVLSVLQQFEWVFRQRNFVMPIHFDRSGNPLPHDEDLRSATHEIFRNTDVFIVTLGLSEVWTVRATGDVLWTAVPAHLWSPDIFKFRVCTVQETKTALGEIVAIVREYVPDAKIIFTLSPIPLAATFRDQGCILSNAASKAILRAALDEFLTSEQGFNRDVFYYPSYEIIEHLFPFRFTHDGRHLKGGIVTSVMKIFEAYYCDGTNSRDSAEEHIMKLSGAMAPVPLVDLLRRSLLQRPLSTIFRQMGKIRQRAVVLLHHLSSVL